MRSYYWLYFYVLSRVIKPIWKSDQWSIVPFLSSFIKIKEHKKGGGFYAHVLLAAIHLVIFKIGTHFAFMSNGWDIHFLWVMIIPMNPYTSPTGYSSGHPWRLVFVSSIQCCQVILSDVPISMEIGCLDSINYRVLCTISPMSFLILSLNHLPLFHVDWWRIP